MPKIKTNSGAKKRFQLTGSGKIKRKHAYKSHILTKKTTKQKRNLTSIERFILMCALNIHDKLMNRVVSFKCCRPLPFETALLVMDRGYESYNLMDHYQEKQ